MHISRSALVAPLGIALSQYGCLRRFILRERRPPFAHAVNTKAGARTCNVRSAVAFANIESMWRKCLTGYPNRVNLAKSLTGSAFALHAKGRVQQ